MSFIKKKKKKPQYAISLQQNKKILWITTALINSIIFFLLSLPKAAVVPSAQTLKITDFSFSDFELSDLETALCTIRMFTDLNLVQNFQMKHEVGMQRHPLEKSVYVCM